MTHHFLTLVILLCTAISASASDTLRVDNQTHGASIIIDPSPASRQCTDSIIIPQPLSPGDLVAIVTPAGQASAVKFDHIATTLDSLDLRCRIAPHADGRSGSFSGTPAERYGDLRDALLDPEVKAIICTRGGYGAVHLLDSLNALPLRENAKWLVGFSDISALHALMLHHGIASIHGPMGTSLQDGLENLSPSCKALFALLEGQTVTYLMDPHPYNRVGTATAPLTGGNMAVLDALISTPYDEFRPGTILFIEDVSEPIYKIQRQLYQLKLSGVLGQLAGLMVGEFTHANPDEDFSSMYDMIRDMTAEYDYPVAFGIPAGHTPVNIPMIIGAPIQLTVTPDGVTLRQ